MPRSKDLFRQHKFQPRAQLRRMPEIFIDAVAMQMMAMFVHICPAEIGWIGKVEQLWTDAGEFIGFRITKVFLMEQMVTATRTHPPDEAMFSFIQEMLETGELSDEDGDDPFRFWGHSHVLMGTEPSGMDLHEIAKQEAVANGTGFFLAGIFNKLGKAEFIVADFEAGVWFRDVPWKIYPDGVAKLKGRARNALISRVEAEIKKKVRIVSKIPTGILGEHTPGIQIFHPGVFRDDTKPRVLGRGGNG